MVATWVKTHYALLLHLDKIENVLENGDFWKDIQNISHDWSSVFCKFRSNIDDYELIHSSLR